jgi:hypothetical protein
MLTPFGPQFIRINQKSVLLQTSKSSYKKIERLKTTLPICSDSSINQLSLYSYILIHPFLDCNRHVNHVH